MIYESKFGLVVSSCRCISISSLSDFASKCKSRSIGSLSGPHTSFSYANEKYSSSISCPTTNPKKISSPVPNAILVPFLPSPKPFFGDFFHYVRRSGAFAGC